MRSTIVLAFSVIMVAFLAACANSALSRPNGKFDVCSAFPTTSSEYWYCVLDK